MGDYLLAPVGKYPGADPVGVHPVSPEAQLQGVARKGGVFKDGCGLVNLVDHQVKVAVSVEVSIGTTVAVRRAGGQPLPGHIGKAQVAVVAEDVVRDLLGRDLAGQGHVGIFHPLVDPALDVFIGDEIHVVHVVGGPLDAVADKDVLVPVVVEIGHQGPP